MCGAAAQAEEKTEFTVTLKAAGSIFVEGQTVPELTETLKAAYAKILHDPIITIALKDFEKPYFIAAGQVTKPGKYELDKMAWAIEPSKRRVGFETGIKFVPPSERKDIEN